MLGKIAGPKISCEMLFVKHEGHFTSCVKACRSHTFCIESNDKYALHFKRAFDNSYGMFRSRSTGAVLPLFWFSKSSNFLWTVFKL